ncbi:MAG: ATP-binding cassette domain-containing protein, partial [Spirochaetota bacterium]
MLNAPEWVPGVHYEGLPEVPEPERRWGGLEGPAPTLRHHLDVRGLRKTYGRKVAVADVSFSMRVGQVTGLLGPNGAGKTTVFYMIVGFIRPTAGHVSIDGHEISRFPMY